MHSLFTRLTVLSILSLGIINVSYAELVKLDFEDLSGSGYLPEDYAGLTWDSDWRYYDWEQPLYTASSGVTRIYSNSYDKPDGGFIDFGEEVTFVGAGIATGDNEPPELYDIEFWWEGYNNGVKLFESDHIFYRTATFMNLNWKNVDYISLKGKTSNYSIIDDLTYITSPVNDVPEPPTTTLLLCIPFILAGAGVIRRKC